ncbi:short-chain dehydrogenase, partial [Streptomyces fulvissimus]|nr:short-chain dehydrogenase [Streptomyces microflavus]
RSAKVYAQPWLRGMQSVRGHLPGIIATVGKREIKRFAPRLNQVPTGLVGSGGAADEKHRAG